MWCVGLCLPGGRHKYRVFNNETKALKYAAAQQRLGGCKVYFWEM